MKFVTFTFFVLVIGQVIGQCDIPQISPRATLVNYGEDVTLNTIGCTGGIINWSNGMTGSTISFAVNKPTSVYATCTNGGCTSPNSEIAGIGINYSYSDCNETENVNSSLDKTFQKTQASVEINGSSSIEDSTNVLFDATQRINLQEGFETKEGAVFQTELTGCKELNTATVITGLNRPWEILWGEDDHIWFTERIGKVGRVNPVTGVRSLDFTIVDCSQFSEGGLLGMALDPAFSSNKYLYVVYCYFLEGQAQTNPNYREKLVRYTYDGVNNTLTSPFIIIQDIKGWNTHNGSRLAFGPDGKLYMTTGDAQVQPSAQDDNILNGKVLRINPDGTVPPDNPISGNFLWSKGHRNAQGLVFGNGKLYSTEHGPSTNDEINIIEKSKNYGWPYVHGYCLDNTLGGEQTYCENNQITEPIAAWTPTIATGGLDYYNSSAIPQWQNSLLLAVLKNQHLKQMKLDPTGSYITEMRDYYVSIFGRLRDICIAPDGRVFICIDSNSGAIIEISPN